MQLIMRLSISHWIIAVVGWAAQYNVEILFGQVLRVKVMDLVAINLLTNVILVMMMTIYYHGRYNKVKLLGIPAFVLLII